MRNLNIETKNPTEALRYARCAERAETLLREGYTFWKDVELETVAVCKPKRLAASYWIDLRESRCSCPDFEQHGDYCKHLLAFKMKEEEDDDADRRAEAEQDARDFGYCTC